nr:MAG TPA: hypothetical protein [Caudoviricetes sp.]
MRKRHYLGKGRYPASPASYWYHVIEAGRGEGPSPLSFVGGRTCSIYI